MSSREDRAGDGADRVAAHVRRPIAYLTNVYPKVSHSFIRNEILALERDGFEVTRLSIRRNADPLPDARDRAEAERTIHLLDGALPGLIEASIDAFVRSPRRWMATLVRSLAENGRSAGLVPAAAYFLEACGLARIMRRRGIDHVHVHFGTNPTTVARLAARLSGVGYSFTVHGPDEFDAPVALRLRDKIADARFAIAISDHGRAQLMRWSRPADWAKLQVVRCGVPAAFLDDAAEVPPPSGDRLLCVARLSAQKGIGVLIDAARLVADRRAFGLDIVGGGEMRDGIEEAIARHGLGDTVRLLGWRDTDGVRDAMLGARALVLPSFAEGLPVVLMEALALGRPVVATSIAGVPELVDASCGWVVPPADPVRLADAMINALSASPERLRAMGRAGRARVLAHHDQARNALALGALLRARAAIPPSEPGGRDQAQP